MRLGKVVGVSAVLFFCATTALAQDVDVMQYADTNGDGKVTAEEYTAFLAQAWDYLMQSADKVKAANVDPMAKGLIAGVTPDANGDITKAAFLAAAPAKFKAADANGDGVLSAAELNASMRAAGG